MFGDELAHRWHEIRWNFHDSSVCWIKSGLVFRDHFLFRLGFVVSNDLLRPTLIPTLWIF